MERVHYRDKNNSVGSTRYNSGEEQILLKLISPIFNLCQRSAHFKLFALNLNHKQKITLFMPILFNCFPSSLSAGTFYLNFFQFLYLSHRSIVDCSHFFFIQPDYSFQQRGCFRKTHSLNSDCNYISVLTTTENLYHIP